MGVGQFQFPTFLPSHSVPHIQSVVSFIKKPDLNQLRPHGQLFITFIRSMSEQICTKSPTAKCVPGSTRADAPPPEAPRERLVEVSEPAVEARAAAPDWDEPLATLVNTLGLKVHLTKQIL